MEIKYVVRKLHLYEEINCAADDETENGRLYNCKTVVTEKNIEPSLDEYIQFDEENKNKVIPAGEYLFVQGVLCSDDKEFPVVMEVKRAAEQLWLEFLWEEEKPAGREIYLRVLDEEETAHLKAAHCFIFQVMRPVALTAL